MTYYVYMLLCEDGSYYTGSARDVDFRFRQHKKGHGARYTKMHKPKKVVYVEKFSTRSEAMQREKRIKRLSHKGKRKLVDSCNA
jgi:putative endonuclease